MSQQITIATFNAENLFTRFRFKEFTQEAQQAATETGFIVDKAMFERSLEAFRILTARAIRGVKADIIGLQEIENLDSLRLFNSGYLKSGKFRFQYVLDGNDPRFIDCGMLSNLEVDFLRTHQFRRKGNSRIFSRDCVEMHLRLPGGGTLPVFVNHFKSMIGGRSQTKARRLLQSNELIAILKERFGSEYGAADFVVLGDLNDYMEAGEEFESGLEPLLRNPHLVNVLDRLPAAKRWTHYFSKKREFRQLDYLFLSRALAERNPGAVPMVERRGMPLRVNDSLNPSDPRFVSEFFPESDRIDPVTGQVDRNTKASDHCPLAITIDV